MPLQTPQSTRDAQVFVIDWRVSMLRTSSSSPSTPAPLTLTLRAIAQILRAKLAARSRDAISIIAFGARATPKKAAWPSIQTIRPLRPVDAAVVNLLQTIANHVHDGDEDNLFDLSSSQLSALPVHHPSFCFGPDIPVEFDKALWAARHQFSTVTAVRNSMLHRKSVFVFTNDHDPSRGNPPIWKQSATQALDLADLGASLHISLLVNPPSMSESIPEELDTPDVGQFFHSLVGSEDALSQSATASLRIITPFSVEDLCAGLKDVSGTRRAMRKSVLVLAEGYTIGVALYALVRKANRPVKVELSAATNKPIFKITTNTCEAVGEILNASSIRHMFMPDYLRDTFYGKSKVPLSLTEGDADDSETSGSSALHGFTHAETIKAKALGKLGLHIYGFRKKHTFPKEYTLGPCTFVYPDDSYYMNSTKAFATLLKCMIKRNVIAIVSTRVSAKTYSGMRFAALVPQFQLASDTTEVSTPSGFQMHMLPFKDDLYTAWRKEMDCVADKSGDEKRIKEEDMLSGELSGESTGVSIARRMARKLTIGNYSPHLFLNPDLQRFHAGLENAAGVESSFNPQDDLLNPDIESMQTRAGHLLTELKRMEAGLDFNGEEQANILGTKSSKRAAEQCQNALRRAEEKRLARREAEKKCEVSMYIARYQDGTLGKMLKAELQLYCRSQGLSERGTKKNLQICVEEHIQDLLEIRGT